MHFARRDGDGDRDEGMWKQYGQYETGYNKRRSWQPDLLFARYKRLAVW